MQSKTNSSTTFYLYFLLLFFFLSACTNRQASDRISHLDSIANTNPKLALTEINRKEKSLKVTNENEKCDLR